ncbi:OPT family oligopeptide transporter [Corallococcus praedator]|uniref:OPT family oligopeptide transporter n=1 Tax=Corallococcus praedator TaxID=2316724 RepID=A0ABX9QIS2_9BACT|nr:MULTISPECIES: OPT family oligopeptide transporter [Corallococcus]RKH29622.1 OPT family oligopeptide transporter [Corallococcus sp. CA031C]RKI09547.1 OPT family oligopeptide transporter [Corallococcus praedator]
MSVSSGHPASPPEAAVGPGEPLPPVQGLGTAGAPASQGREWTVRALGMGLLIGALLAVTNLYMGMKTGWWDSGSITATVLGFSGLAAYGRRRGVPYTPLENNLTQTAASAVGAMPAAAGLLGALPALALLGVAVPGWGIAAWGLVLGTVGVLVAGLLRRRLLEQEALPFPTGIATAELISTLHAATPTEAPGASVGRGRTLVGAGVVAMVVTWMRDSRGWLPGMVGLPGRVGGAPLESLTWGVGVSPMLLAVGMMTGLQLALSMLLGAVVAWGVLAPVLLGAGVVVGAEYGPLSAWLAWPGVGLMVGAAVVSLGAQARDFLSAAKDLRSVGANRGGLPRWALGVAAVACVLAVVLGGVLFGLGVPSMVLALALLVPLCAVCARGAGQTDVSPVSQMGNLTQVVFGGVRPGELAPNVAAGSVVAGAAAQTGVSLWSLKAGHLLGASSSKQLAAQLVGVAVGAVVAVPAYLLLVDAYGLGTAALPVPAAAQFRAVAEVSVRGLAGLPPHAGMGALVGCVVGAVLTLASRGRAAKWLPSPVAMGIGFITPAFFAVTLCLGAGMAAIARRWSPKLTDAQVPAVGSGALVGESLMGLIIAATTALQRSV